MVDIKLLREDPERFKRGAEKKGFDVNIDDISKITVPAITEAIKAFRSGDYIIKPGGGGEYGHIFFPKEKDKIILSVDREEL